MSRAHGQLPFHTTASLLRLSSGEGRVVVESLSDCEVGFRDRRGGHTGWKSFAFDRVWGPHEVSLEPPELGCLNIPRKGSSFLRLYDVWH